MSKRTSWTVLFCASTMAYALVVSVGQSVWTLFALAPPLLGAVASFGFLYARGDGLPEKKDARRTNG